MRITAALVLLTLAWSDSAMAQEWAPFTTVQDGFTINYPGQPSVVHTTWRSQLDFVLPARVYCADRGFERYSITLIDYSGIEQLGIERAKNCPPGNANCRANAPPALGPKDGTGIRYENIVYSNAYHGMGVYTAPPHVVPDGGAPVAVIPSGSGSAAPGR